MPRKSKQVEQLPFGTWKEPERWKISEQTKRAGRHWFPIWRKQLEKSKKEN